MKDKYKSEYTLGVLDVVLVVFIILKLANLVDWAWPVVLIPFFVQCGIAVIWAIVILVVAYRYKKSISGR